MPGTEETRLPWVALDVETTGLSPTRHRIRELAIVRFSSEEQDPGRVLRIPQREDPAGPRPRWTDRLRRFMDEITKARVVVAHNAAFDLAFLAESLRRTKTTPFHLHAYCTLMLSRSLFPELARHDLDYLGTELRLGHRPDHTALGDARAVASLLRLLSRRFDIKSEEDLAAVHGPQLKVRCRSSACAFEDDSHAS